MPFVERDDILNYAGAATSSSREGSLSVVNEKRERHLGTRTSFTGTLPGKLQELPPEGWPVVWERERQRRDEGTRICKHGHRSV